MLYSKEFHKSYNKEVSYKNRGMELEYLIEKANIYYRDHDIAYIYKKPTPIKVVDVKYTSKGKRITDAFYETPSTLDFNGIYKGYYVEFDAKETNNNTSFPIQNVHNHQIKHLENITNHHGIAFLIIAMANNYYLLMARDFLSFLNNETRKSIPLSYLEEHAYKISMSLRGLDYIKVLDEIIGGNL